MGVFHVFMVPDRVRDRIYILRQSLCQSQFFGNFGNTDRCLGSCQVLSSV